VPIRDTALSRQQVEPADEDINVKAAGLPHRHPMRGLAAPHVSFALAAMGVFCSACLGLCRALGADVPNALLWRERGQKCRLARTAALRQPLAVRMVQPTAAFLRAQISRIRRLLAEAWDKKTERALKELAQEYEVRASELDGRKKPEEDRK
jgi:hypothetical protein